MMDRIPLFPECTPKTKEKDLKCFQDHMEKHIKTNFRYPEEAKSSYIEGVVKLMMTIKADGTITNLRAKGPHPLLEAEAIRIMKLIPRLQPALLEGNTVSVPYSIPITFRL